MFFYTNRTGLLLNGIYNNLLYGAYAPGVPNVFINDAQFKDLWQKPERFYLFAQQSDLPRFQGLIAPAEPIVVARSGGKIILTNHPLQGSAAQQVQPETGKRKGQHGYGGGGGFLNLVRDCDHLINAGFFRIPALPAESIRSAFTS